MQVKPTFKGYINVCSCYPDSQKSHNRGGFTPKTIDKEFKQLLEEMPVDEEAREISGNLKDKLVNFFKKAVEPKHLTGCDAFFKSETVTIYNNLGGDYFEAHFPKETHGCDKSLIFQYDHSNRRTKPDKS